VLREADQNNRWCASLVLTCANIAMYF